MANPSKLKPLFAGVLFASLAACSTMHANVAKEHSEALPPASDTPTAKYVESEQSRHAPDQSGFRLMTLSTNALMSRVSLADHAEHSLDLQYYIFQNDQTGKLIAEHLLKAADRGVRVRILLDDIQQDQEVRMFDALDAHENIEVRLFNPFNTRNPNFLSKTTQLLFEFRRLNRRMHNKSYIADNKLAIVGGRNIADGYFDANEKSNFRDLDLLTIGPVVQQASTTFDTYWNDETAVPVTAFPSKRDTKADLVKLRQDFEKNARAFEQSDYAQAVVQELPNGPTADRRGQWFWGSAVLVADQPEKVDASEHDPALRIGPAVRNLIDGAQTEVMLTSPYFVPSDNDTKEFIALAKRGVATRILTNSLASTDEPAVHVGYTEHRRTLIEGGVNLYELKPVAGIKQTAAQSSAGVGLHAKSLVVDRRYVFVGSMNMDPRSKLLNTEMGLIVDSPALAKAVADFFTTITLPANAYHVTLENSGPDGKLSGAMRWEATEDGKPVTLTHEPEVGIGRRTKVLLLKLLPIDSLL